MLPLPEYRLSVLVRRLLVSNVGDLVITTNIDAGLSFSDAGHVWHRSPNETPDALHARAVRTIQIAQET